MFLDDARGGPLRGKNAIADPVAVEAFESGGVLQLVLLPVFVPASLATAEDAETLEPRLERDLFAR